MSNLQLLEILNNLQNNYAILATSNNNLNDDDINNNSKNELKKLCIYLKNEIENGNIKLINNDLLINIINDKLILLLQDNIDWEIELLHLNNFCNELYLFNQI